MKKLIILLSIIFVFSCCESQKEEALEEYTISIQKKSDLSIVVYKNIWIPAAKQLFVRLILF
jgi:Tfp pilus assembly protein PilP